MSGVEISDLLIRFKEYTDNYLARAGEGAPNVQLKIDHSLRVLDIADAIARNERFDAPTARMVSMAALFHDTGRFPQYERWGVFNDASSENHAKLGVKALLASDLLRGLDPLERRTVLGAVFLHNTRRLPKPLPRPLDSVVRAVRDADKLDIYPVILAHLGGGRPPNKVVTMGIEPHPTNYTPGMLTHLEERRIAPYGDMRWHNDFKLLLLSWVYDLNHPAALRMLHELGYVEQVLESLPLDEPLARVREQLRADLAARL